MEREKAENGLSKFIGDPDGDNIDMDHLDNLIKLTTKVRGAKSRDRSKTNSRERIGMRNK